MWAPVESVSVPSHDKSSLKTTGRSSPTGSTSSSHGNSSLGTTGRLSPTGSTSSPIIGDGTRRTNIQVCVRVRPLLVADTQRVVTHLPSHSDTRPESAPSAAIPKHPKGKDAAGIVKHHKSKTRSRLQPPSTIRGKISSRVTTNRGTALRKHDEEFCENVAVSAYDMSALNNQEDDFFGGTKSAGRDPSLPAWDVSGNTVHQSQAFDQNPTRKKSYAVDRVFGPQSPTSSIYYESVRDVVLSAMEGYHGSVFAYGQTCSGKTYTMGGSPEEPGVIPLAVRDCFGFIKHYNNRNEEREYLLRVSYMEIYNEQINDLLAPAGTGSATAVRIFESKSEGVIVRGLREEIVTSPEQVFALIESGDVRRHTGSTNLNKQSSRSHSIFRLLIESRLRNSLSNGARKRGSAQWDTMSDCSTSSPPSTEDGSSMLDLSGPVRVSSLSLVDLAGSECVKATGSTGMRQKEGHFINKSLMTLGHVIWKLSEMSVKAGEGGRGGAMQSQHIPYRDSKLTRLLQPSLSGNAQICVICNLSPQLKNLEESHNTLKFAIRAKRIKQNATVTEVVDEKTLLQNYREEIEGLKKQLREAREEQKALQQYKQGERSPKSATHFPSSSDNDQDIGVLVAAIDDLEHLILKRFSINKSSAQKTPEARNANQHAPRTNRMKCQAAGSSEDAAVETSDGDPWQAFNNDEDAQLLSVRSKEEPSRNALFRGDGFDDELLLTAEEDETIPDANVLEELQRIRGLLGTVMKRKTIGDTPTPVRSWSGSLQHSFGKRKGNNNYKPRNEEVELLKAQLHEKEVASSLREADSSFLQNQLEEKSSLLGEVLHMLETVETRHKDLELENAKMKDKIRSRDAEIAALKAQMSEEEDLFSNLM